MDSNLQSKLQHYSTTPPNGVWDKIADALDADDGYVQRLYHYEEQPPTAAWQAIEKGVDEAATPARVVPFTTRFKKPLRYLAVASLIGVILVTITLSMKRTEAGALQAGSNTTVPEEGTATVNHTATASGSTTPADSSTLVTANDPRFSPPASQPDPQDEVLAAARQKKIIKTARAGAAYSAVSNYVLFTDGDGRLRRVSKKLADMVNCKENDGSCQQRLQQLRQKMAASAMTSDFTGILEMLHQLQ